MIEHEFTRAVNPDRLVFLPPLDADFQPVSVPVPEIKNLSGILAFQDSATVATRAKCGNIDKCEAVTHLSIAEVAGSLTVKGASIRCSRMGCPLRNQPPDTGDSEPLEPSPTPPALIAEAEIPYPA